MDSSVKSALATRVASGDRRIWNLRKGGLSSDNRLTIFSFGGKILAGQGRPFGFNCRAKSPLIPISSPNTVQHLAQPTFFACLDCTKRKTTTTTPDSKRCICFQLDTNSR